MKNIDDYLKKINNPDQMSISERKYIYETIHGNCKNLLVWGVGIDTELWHECCDNTVFVEHNVEWINKVRQMYSHHDLSILHGEFHMFDTIESCKTAITSNDVEKYDVYINGGNIDDVTWDAVIIDGPSGYYQVNEYYRPGSAYTTTNLSLTEKADVFLHDVNRPVEELIIENILSEFNEIYRVHNLLHVRK